MVPTTGSNVYTAILIDDVNGNNFTAFVNPNGAAQPIVISNKSHKQHQQHTCLSTYKTSEITTDDFVADLVQHSKKGIKI